MRDTDRIIYERGYGPGDGDSHVERVDTDAPERGRAASDKYQELLERIERLERAVFPGEFNA